MYPLVYSELYIPSVVNFNAQYKMGVQFKPTNLKHHVNLRYHHTYNAQTQYENDKINTGWCC
jgi:hypothetical protein